MKNISLAMTAVFVALALCGCGKEKEYEPTTLVIESSDITGIYEGTISISGKGREDICVEGAIRIDADGNQIHITMSDAVNSVFDKEF